MSRDIYCTGPRDKHIHRPPTGIKVINTTSKGGWSSLLSPFVLGPCPLYKGAGGGFRTSLSEAKNMENLWQFSKVYKQFTTPDGDPNLAYWDWACRGWLDRKAHRYPMGKGAKPEYSFWNGERLNYIDARKRIYVPQYAAAVVASEGWTILQRLADESPIVLWDFDGCNYRATGRTLTELLNDPSKPFGHSLVLCALLTGELDPGECIEHVYHGRALRFAGTVIAP